MSLQAAGKSYRLSYLPEEDRVLFALDVAPGQELGILLTRRFLRNFLDVFAKFVAERVPPAAKQDPLTRDTVLDFAHKGSVANAIADGSMRSEKMEAATPLAAPGLVHEAKLLSNGRGGVALLFFNPEHSLKLEIGPKRVHMVLETFIRIGERAGWDFPPPASWLDPSKAGASPEGKTVN